MQISDRIVKRAGMVAAFLAGAVLGFGQSAQPLRYEPPGMPPGPARTLTLGQYAGILRSYAHSRQMGVVSPKTVQPGPEAIVAADPELAKIPAVRQETLAALREVARTEAEVIRLQAKIWSEQTKPSLQNDGSNRRRPKVDKSVAEQNKAQEQVIQLQQEIEKYVEQRVQAINKLAETPLGQQFALPENSDLFCLLMRRPLPAKPVLGTNGLPQPQPAKITFEAVSQMDGGMIAFRTAMNNGARVTYPESYFIRGYEKPFRRRELIEMTVVPGKTVTINNIVLKEYVVVK